MADTNKFGLPIMTSAQAQKHVTFNEAMIRLEAVSQVSVINTITLTPPASPSEGDAYVIAGVATGVWLGRENDIAVWSNSQWLYATPTEGWCVYDILVSGYRVFNGASWVRSDAKFGMENYEDTATAGSPISLVAGETWYDLTNNGLGGQTSVVGNGTEAGPFYDASTGQFDFSNLAIGDVVRITAEMLLDVSGANGDFAIRCAYGSAFGLTKTSTRSRYKTALTDEPLCLTVEVPILNAGQRDNPAKLQMITTNAGSTVKVQHFTVQVHRP